MTTFCTARTSDGPQCCRKTLPGKPHCGTHDPDRAAERNRRAAERRTLKWNLRFEQRRRREQPL